MNSPAFQPDLDRYFSRIRYTGSREPTLATLHGIAAHHTAAIPFENLDVLLGRAIKLDPAAIERKLIHDCRGGYCFEQNGYLLLVLTSLGFKVTPLSARVRLQLNREIIPPRTHVFLRIELPGDSWLVDAGVGSMSLSAAIRLNHPGEQSTLHEPRRIVQEGLRWFHQARLGEEWSDVCEFTLEEMPLIDRELANWWTSTNPDSKFRKSLAVARAGLDGTRRAIRDDTFIIRRGAEIITQRTLTSPGELLDVLGGYFDLKFPAETRFGPPASPWPS